MVIPPLSWADENGKNKAERGKYKVIPSVVFLAYIQQSLTEGWLLFSDLGLCLRKPVLYPWINCASVKLFNPSWDPPERLVSGVCCGNESVLNCCAFRMSPAHLPPSFPAVFWGFFGRGFNNKGWKLHRQPDFSWGLVMSTYKWWKRGRTSWETVQSILLGLHRRWTGSKNSIFFFL